MKPPRLGRCPFRAFDGARSKSTQRRDGLPLRKREKLVNRRPGFVAPYLRFSFRWRQPRFHFLQTLGIGFEGTQVMLRACAALQGLWKLVEAQQSLPHLLSIRPTSSSASRLCRAAPGRCAHPRIAPRRRLRGFLKADHVAQHAPLAFESGILTRFGTTAHLLALDAHKIRQPQLSCEVRSSSSSSVENERHCRTALQTSRATPSAPAKASSMSRCHGGGEELLLIRAGREYRPRTEPDPAAEPGGDVSHQRAGFTVD